MGGVTAPRYVCSAVLRGFDVGDPCRSSVPAATPIELVVYADLRDRELILDVRVHSDGVAPRRPRPTLTQRDPGSHPNLLVLPNSLSDFRTTIGAFVDQVDLRRAPMRLYVSNIHRQSHAARTNNHRRLNFVVVVNVGWHVGSPSRANAALSQPTQKLVLQAWLNH